MNANIFSKRNGYNVIHEVDITIREDAPIDLRNFIRTLFYDLDKKPSSLRKIVCPILRKSPDSDNWTEYPNIDTEVGILLEECDWFRIYDIIETIVSKLERDKKEYFISEMNDYFISKGIGWKIVDDLIEMRGDDVFESTIQDAKNVLEDAKLATAKTEIKEAILDLSRRPEPDITGAIQHSLACLECVVREFSGDKKLTLGDLMKKHSTIIPPPLNIAVEKLWGYASEQGRHLKEGRAPEHIEADLVVRITAALSIYLGKKISSNTVELEDELPF